MKMTKERLEDYRSKKDEIPELQYKINHLSDGNAMVGNSTIFDYSTGFPRAQAVVGFDKQKYNRLQARYQKRLEQLQQECEEIELWIEEISDSLTRRIFRMYYIDKVQQRVIAKKVHLTQSKVSERISKFLQSG